MVNGADALVSSLVRAGVDTCFANPGTTEMHLVAALGREPSMSTYLCLFEGVATGAADGYARMARRPASTLLHLGPGLANGLANLHNARKAATPVFNIVGEHASHHRELDAPLSCDIEGLAGPVSRWVRTAGSADEVASLAAEALAVISDSRGGVATLMVPNDAAWDEASAPRLQTVAEPADLPRLGDPAEAARALKRSDDAMLLLGSPFITRRAAELADAIGRATGCRVMTEAANARMARGGGAPLLKRLPFHVDPATESLRGVTTAVLAGAREPVAFFAYPGRASRLLPESCAIVTLAEPGADLEAVLETLAEAVGAEAVQHEPHPHSTPALPDGPLTPEGLAAAVTATLPEDTIVVDESVTSGVHLYPMTAAAPAHDWINNRGGSIGYSMPVGIGAAVACPDRRVLCVTGDGSAFYTLQSLWTMARYRLDVTVVILANNAYRILNNEMSKIGAGAPGNSVLPLIDLADPAADWTAIAKGQGVEAARAATAAELAEMLAQSYRRPGPMLIMASLL